MGRRIYAIFFLGVRYAIHILKALSPLHRRPGLSKFRENYLPDGITFLTAAERQGLPKMERCVGCDACLHGYFKSRPYSPEAPTPRDLALSLSRSMPDYRAARRVLSEWQNLEWFREVCPLGVDLGGLVALMKRHLAEYDSAAAHKEQWAL